MSSDDSPEGTAHVRGVGEDKISNYVDLGVTATVSCDCGNTINLHGFQNVICQDCGEEWRLTTNTC